MNMDESASDAFSSLSSVVSPGRKRSADEQPTAAPTASKRGRTAGRGRGAGSRGGRGRGRGSRGAFADSSSMASVPRSAMGDFEDEDDTSLYTVVKGSSTIMRLRQLADRWIKLYEENRDEAICQLVQFFFSSSGCRGNVDQCYVNTGDYTQLIRRMTEEFDEDTGDYPLILSGASWKRFRQTFCDFVQLLVKQCQHNIIYDQVLMDNVITLLTALADSQVRAFRHTATLAAVKLMSALVEVVIQLGQTLEHMKRQYDTEFSKARPHNDRLEALEKKKGEMEENIEELNNMTSYMFKSIFVHRYRDVIPEIRSMCIVELGNWIAAYPAMFLDDSYLKYIGWTLSDKIGEVRLKCLQTLLPLYSDEELYPKLELFTNKFKARVVTMALDKEFEVAVMAVKVVICLLKCYPGVLADRDCETIYELVYASHRGLAIAAGEFLNVRLFKADPQAVQGLRTNKGKPCSANTPLIRDLVLFFIESELHQHGAYVIDALIDSNEMVKDWECMTDLLLEEPGEDQEPLDDRQESVLIELMVCAVKQAATGEPPVGRGSNRKYLSMKEHKHIQDEKAKISKHFMQVLPNLIQKYAADGEKVNNLLQIPLHFELEMYSSMRLEKHLDALLKSTEEVLDKHTDDEVLQACSKVLEYLCSEQVAAIQARCDTAKAKLIDGIVMRLRQNLQQFNEEMDDLDEEDTAAVMVCMRKVHNLYQCHDLSKWELWDLFFNIVRPSEDQQQTVPPAVVARAFQCCHYELLWNLKRLEDAGCDKDNMQRLKRRLDDFVSAGVDTLLSGQDGVADTAFLSLCDLFLVFGWHLAERQPRLQSLCIDADTTEDSLIAFVRRNVFVEAEEDEMDEHQQIEILHKRRNILAGFCKLVIYNVVRIKAAADIFQFYVKFYNDYGDIIRTTLGKCRENNRVLCARAMASSLSGLFLDLKAQSEAVDSHSEGFSSVRELAKRFALSFGPDALRSRDAVVSLHKEGIDFALHTDDGRLNARAAPPNLTFLEALAELSNKLVKADKKSLLTYVDKQIPAGSIPPGDDWQSLVAYRASLQDADDMPPPAAGVGVTPARRGRGRAAKYFAGDVSSFAPATTSTAVKRPRLESDQLSDAGSDFRDGSRSNITFAS